MGSHRYLKKAEPVTKTYFSYQGGPTILKFRCDRNETGGNIFKCINMDFQIYSKYHLRDVQSYFVENYVQTYILI